MASMSSQAITIQVNGLKQEIPDGTTLEGLLCLFSLQKKSVAVERNHEVADKATYALTELKENDSIEIVHFVGGG